MGKQDRNDIAVLEFAKGALRSLADCVVRIDSLLLRRWFVSAFNHWYCPAVRRGYNGTMTPVFDLGMVLCDVSVMMRRQMTSEEDKKRQDYMNLLEQIGQSPMMAVARDILDSAEEEIRPQVARPLVESLLRALDGIWDTEGEAPSVNLPWLEAIEGGQTVAILEERNSDRRLGTFPLSLDVAKGTTIKYPRLAPDTKVTQVLDRVRLFIASVLAHAPNAEQRLDYQVIEACLRGPNVRTAQHDPPPLHRTETIKHSRSILPGTNAGVTRAEVKLPEDPPISILPSELTPVMAWESTEVQDNQLGDRAILYPRKLRTKGLLQLADILLNRKPLVYKRENPRDLIPKHRALVCFVVSAGATSPPEAVNPSVHAYSNAYVYAKRQIFDLIRDLREALEQVLIYSFVEVDVAVFGLCRNQGDTLVHSKFPLDRMPLRQSSEVLKDRLKQAMAFDCLVPGFFHRLPSDGRTYRYWQGRRAPGQMANPHVGAFLRHEAKNTKPYHAVHLVLAGSRSDLLAFMVVMGRSSSFEMRSRQHLTLIGVDLTIPDIGRRVPVEGEPAWLYMQSRTVSEVSAMLARGQLPRISLEMLRRQFVESVMGRVRQRSSSVRCRIRMM